MRKLFTGLMLLAALTIPSMGKCMDTGTTVEPTAAVTFLWDANTEEDLAGYKLYCSTDAVNYSLIGATNETTITVTLGLSKGAYCAVTAYNNYGLESAYSNIVRIYPMVTPGSPKNVRHSVQKR